jgi:hypothetical protein
MTFAAVAMRVSSWGARPCRRPNRPRPRDAAPAQRGPFGAGTADRPYRQHRTGFADWRHRMVLRNLPDLRSQSRRTRAPARGRHIELIRGRAGESADFELEACDAQGRLAATWPTDRLALRRQSRPDRRAGSCGETKRPLPASPEEWPTGHRATHGQSWPVMASHGQFISIKWPIAQPPILVPACLKNPLPDDNARPRSRECPGCRSCSLRR